MLAIAFVPRLTDGCTAFVPVLQATGLKNAVSIRNPWRGASIVAQVIIDR